MGQTRVPGKSVRVGSGDDVDSSLEEGRRSGTSAQDYLLSGSGSWRVGCSTSHYSTERGLGRRAQPGPRTRP